MAELSSSSIIDVSFAGSVVTVADVTIRNFMDDANPVEFPDCEVTSYGMNLNGCMIRYAKPTAIVMSVTVIPGSDEDKELYKKWAEYRVQDGKNKADKWSEGLTASIVLGNQGSSGSGGGGQEYRYSGGTFVSGPGGPSSSPDGKMRGRTYTFAFAKVEF